MSDYCAGYDAGFRHGFNAGFHAALNTVCMKLHDLSHDISFFTNEQIDARYQEWFGEAKTFQSHLPQVNEALEEEIES